MQVKDFILKLNNYGYTQEVVNKVLEYKTSGKIRDYVKGKRHYQEKWKPFFVSQDGHLIYRPNKWKVIIDPEEKKLISKIFDNDRYGVGAGIRAVYHILCKNIYIFKELKLEIILNVKTYINYHGILDT